MDIKNVLKAVMPIATTEKKVESAIKTGSTTDRDANGQQQYPDGQSPQQQEMTEEQFAAALKSLQNSAAVKDNNLLLEVQNHEGKRFVILKEVNGRVLRRIPEQELWTLQASQQGKDSKKGQLLRKTA